MRKFYRMYAALMLPCIAFGAFGQSPAGVCQKPPTDARPALSAGIEGINAMLQPKRFADSYGAALPKKQKIAARTSAVKTGFLYEDFSDVGNDGALPQGWTTTATPGTEDCWHAGTLQLNGKPVEGAYDYKYAYILGNHDADAKAHDAWMFSPNVYLEAGKEYQIEFYFMMLPAGDIKEKLSIAIGQGANAEAMTTVLETLEEENDHWDWKGYSFTPTESGYYNIGFHSESPARSNGTLIENVMISDGNCPFFYGEGVIDFGTVDLESKYAEKIYDFYNSGFGDLEVSLVSASPELTVTGLPVTLPAYEYGSFNVALNLTSDDPEYKGTVVIATNDPILGDHVEIPVIATVKSNRVTDFVFEDFEKGGPQGWELSKIAVNTALSGVPGHNGSSRVFYTETWNCQLPENELGVGFTTHYVRMGESPKFSFYYNLANVDEKDNVLAATPAEDVRMSVQVTDDGGRNWTEVYKLEPGTATEHVPNLDWSFLSIDLPQYAGKTCRFRVLFNNAGEAVSYRVLVDDVSIGTQPSTDLRAISVTGPTVTTKGTKATYTGTVQNLGTEPANGFSVDLYDQYTGLPLATTTESKTIDSGAFETFSFDWTPANAGTYKLVITTSCDGDTDYDNDLSSAWWVDVVDNSNSPITINHDEQLASQAYPVNFNACESATQCIYYANEIGINSGDITSLTYTAMMQTDYFSSPFEVYVCETNLEDFTSEEMIDPSRFTKVFDGSIYFQPGMTQFTIPFSQAYHYKGGNLVVMTHMKSDEFIYNKYFIVHRQIGKMRSIQKSSLNKDRKLEEMKTYVDDVFPEIVINMVKAESGKLSGTVTDGNAPVAGVKVMIDGTMRNVETADDGTWEIPEIALGSYKVSFSKHGFQSKTEDINVASPDETRLNTVMARLPKRTLEGTVRNAASHEAVPGVTVTLEGYDNFSTLTDENGHYIINGICGNVGDNYSIRLYSPFYDAHVASVDVDNVSTFDVNLNESRIEAFHVKGTLADDIVMLSWDKPIPEFRYDNGVFHEAVGFDTGGEQAIVGAAFRQRTRIKEVRWYLSNEHGPEIHSGYNVFIFGLNSEGEPDPKNILYTARDVDYVEKGWCSHTLSHPIEADGYMVAISCNGFLSIGVSEPDEQHPFEEGQNYYAGDSYLFHISPMSTYRNSHFMIRAYGDYLEAGDDPEISRPEVNYEVYRFAEGDNNNADAWTLIGSTASTVMTDKNFGDLDKGDYRYAVKVVYKSGVSEPAFSEIISKDTNGVETIGASTDTRIVPNPCPSYFRITNAEYYVGLQIVDLEGKLMLNTSVTDESIDVSDFAKGIYLVLLTDADGKVTTLKLIKN